MIVAALRMLLQEEKENRPTEQGSGWELRSQAPESQNVGEASCVKGAEETDISFLSGTFQ